MAATSIIQRAWKDQNAPHLSGWVYDLHDGIIQPLIEIPPGAELKHPIYRYDFE